MGGIQKNIQGLVGFEGVLLVENWHKTFIYEQ